MTSPASKRLLVPFLAILLVALAAFGRSFTNKLSYDGRFLVLVNATFREAGEKDGALAKVGALNKLFHEEFWEGVNRARDPGLAVEGQALYRPLMLWPMGMIYLASGAKALPFNLLNFAYHLGCSFLLFVLVTWLFASRRIAWIAALLFAAHPVHTEAVAYAAGLGETQSLFFGLLAMALYLKSAGSHVVKVQRYLLALVAFAISLFTKESGAIALIAIVLADIVRRREAPPLSRRLLLYAGFAAVIAINIYVRLEVCGRLQPNENGILRLDNALVKQPFMTCLATGVTLFTRALQLFVVPVGMSADYSFNQMPIARGLSEPVALASFVIVAVLTIIGFVMMRRSAAIGFGVLLFLFAFGPVSNILVRIGTIFGDRLLYQPSAGLAIAAGGVVAAVLAMLERRGETAFRAGRAALFGVLLLFVVLTSVRGNAYKDERTLFENMTRTAPNSARAWFQLAETQRFERDFQNAAQNFRRSIDIMPDFLLAHTGLALSLASLHDYKTASEILGSLLKSVPDRPNWRLLRNTLTQTLKQVITMMKVDAEANASDREFGLAQLRELLEASHRSDPANLDATIALAELYVQLGRLDEGLALIDAALLTNPTDERLLIEKLDILRYRGDRAASEPLMAKLAESKLPEAERVLQTARAQFAYVDGMLALRDGKKDAAREFFETARQIWDAYLAKFVEDWIGYYSRGVVMQDGFERPVEASEDYKKAIELNPGLDDAYTRLADCAIRVGRFDANVVKLIEHVDQHNPKSPSIKLRCARVYSAVGRNEDAEKKLKEAIDLGVQSPDVYTRLSATLIALSKHDEALSLLEKGESLGWESAGPDENLHNAKGAALLELRREADALAEFERAVEILRTKGAPADPMFHARLQVAKTLIRIKGREKEGMDGLTLLETDMQRVLADPATDTQTQRSVKTKGLFVLRQKAYAFAHVESMKDQAQEVALLEEAVKRMQDIVLDPSTRAEFLNDLANAYERAGQMDAAQKTRQQLRRAAGK